MTATTATTECQMDLRRSEGHRASHRIALPHIASRSDLAAWPAASRGQAARARGAPVRVDVHAAARAGAQARKDARLSCAEHPAASDRATARRTAPDGRVRITLERA